MTTMAEPFTNAGYAVLRVDDFALHALRRSDPGLAGRPVALIAGEGRKAVVAEVSPEAAAVTPGLPVTLAMARCPGLLLRPRDPTAELEAGRRRNGGTRRMIWTRHLPQKNVFASCARSLRGKTGRFCA